MYGVSQACALDYCLSFCDAKFLLEVSEWVARYPYCRLRKSSEGESYSKYLSARTCDINESRVYCSKQCEPSGTSCLISICFASDEDRGELCARGNGGMQHFIPVPSPEALTPVLKDPPGRTQTARSRKPVCSMPADAGIPVSIQAASAACYSRNSHRSQGGDLHISGRGVIFSAATSKEPPYTQHTKHTHEPCFMNQKRNSVASAPALINCTVP